MKVYIDLILIVNFFIDLIILLTVSIVLKRNAKLRRLILSSFMGTITVLVLFIDMNNLELTIFKLFTSFIILLIAFGYKDIKYFLNNLLYFYTASITLGGFLYLLKINISFKKIGFIFYNSGLELSFIFIVIFSPLILYIYIRQIKELKLINTYRKKVNVYINGKIIELNGYIDSGNTLKEPYGNKYVIIAKSKELEKETKLNNFIFVPYKTINHEGIIKCVLPEQVYIEDLGLKTNVVIGISDKSIKMDGIDCLLNILLIENR